MTQISKTPTAAEIYGNSERKQAWLDGLPAWLRCGRLTEPLLDALEPGRPSSRTRRLQEANRSLREERDQAIKRVESLDGQRVMLRAMCAPHDLMDSATEAVWLLHQQVGTRDLVHNGPRFDGQPKDMQPLRTMTSRLLDAVGLAEPRSDPG